MEINGCFLETRMWTFELHKRCGIPWPAKGLQTIKNMLWATMLFYSDSFLGEFAKFAEVDC